MPARQDQTLQIFLIIFIFAFLVSAVVAYLGWRGYSEADTKATALQTQLNDKTTQNQNQGTELEDLRAIIGFGRNDNAAEVKKATEADMKNFGGSVADENSRTYKKVLETVFAEGQATAAREAKTKDTVKSLQDRLTAKEGETKKQTDQYEAQIKKLQEDLAHEQAGFNEARKGLEAQQAQLQKNLADQQTKYEGQIAERDAAIKQLKETVPKLEHQIQNLNAYRKDEPGSFEIADGRVSWVNQNGTLWINLGTADSLRRQVTFSVFDADQHDAAKATKKGSIEVTQLMGDHLAEARITSDNPKNPILTGDNIYSQVWHRGKKLHFALTGAIDFDGDGQSDMELARKLIELNGGIVDAYLKEDGKIEGAISADTRYLVLGEVPDSALKVGMTKGYNDMSKEATSLGVQTITLPQFLDQMGYKPPERTVHLGKGASGRDFPPRRDSGTAPPESQPSFHPRALKPPAATSTTKP